ncbi:MAG: asparagine synthase (glutamine-hydrolyzing) [Cyclobacteriaceae bacterium]|nr:asparagine synthase (glutamine-hydrolyzing) [Cyclobacteriaceae bacterium]
MRQTLTHRGPDVQNSVWYENPKQVLGLGHTRLSILDTSSLGDQPMIFAYFSIVLNGEVYNFQEIKEELLKLGHSFISNSDTEVVLHAFAEWGTECVHRFVGMFAFVIYDQKQKKLYLCRDRVGVKPLFYYWHLGIFLFTSELKAFHEHDGFEKKINKEALPLYLKHGFVPEPKSIFDNVYKLESGHWLTFDLEKQTLSKSQYWNIEDFYKQPILNISYEDAKVEMEDLLKSACQYRMVSDVPVGVFLSGGFDSTLVTALLQKKSSSRLKTFTIGFPDGENEAPFAKEIAEYIGTEHTSLDCTEAEAKSIIPDLAYYYDEPCADISTIPTILVSKLAKQKVTVALSADGGDELFAGYDGFKISIDQLNRIRKIPLPKILGVFLSIFSKLILYRNVSLKKKIEGISAVLRSKKPQQFETLLKNSSGMPSFYLKKFLKKNYEFDTNVSLKDKLENINDERNIQLLKSFTGSLKDLLLVKVDRATMSESLEGREPLLDHRLIEYAAQLPYEFKQDGIKSKRILKDIVYKYVPQSLMDRPKIGFDLPIFKWLKNDLSFLIDEYLSEESLKKTDCFDVDEVLQTVDDFKDGTLQYNDIIWRLLHFQMWYEKWVK